MSDVRHLDALQISRRKDGVIVINGELNEGNAEQVLDALAFLPLEPNGEIVLEMFGLDLADGVAVAVTINALRGLLRRVKKLTLIGAPQLLCHNLYRVGLLEANAAIELLAMREDEPYG